MTPSESLFREGRLSLGLMLPLRAQAGPEVDFRHQIELALLAERLGFAAIWVRDVPLNGPWYPEEFGHLDPTVMLGAIAARTSRLALGTAAMVLPLRDPLHLAKAAVSLDILSAGRFLLGLGAGDRTEEFAGFGLSAEDRRDLYRDHWERLAAALERPPRVMPAIPGGAFELRPAARSRIGLLAIGSGGQSLEWIARHAIGWATYHRPPEAQRDRHALWRRAVERMAPGQFRSFSTSLRVDLARDRAAPAEPVDLGYRTGAIALRGVIEAMRDGGVHHVMLNITPDGRPPQEAMEEIAEVVSAAL